MTPPKAPKAGESAAAGVPPAVSACLKVIQNRADFLRAARGARAPTPGFVLQGWDRDDAAPARVGYTCSRKVGNAVARNRAKRRLREIARLSLGPLARPGWDYVLIGRAGATATRDFATLQDDLAAAVARIHKARE